MNVAAPPGHHHPTTPPPSATASAGAIATAAARCDVGPDGRCAGDAALRPLPAARVTIAAAILARGPRLAIGDTAPRVGTVLPPLRVVPPGPPPAPTPLRV